jgi:hypothetical protein
MRVPRGKAVAKGICDCIGVSHEGMTIENLVLVLQVRVGIASTGTVVRSKSCWNTEQASNRIVFCSWMSVKSASLGESALAGSQTRYQDCNLAILLLVVPVASNGVRLLLLSD